MLSKAPVQLETLAEAAARLRCHPRTLRRRIAAGQLAAYRIGLGNQTLRLDSSEVDALLRPIPTAGTAA